MKFKMIIMKSAVISALFCFSHLYSLPLTRTVYTSSEEKIDITAGEEFISLDDGARRDIFELELGLTGRTSAGFYFTLLHDGMLAGEGAVPGDMDINIWHYAGDSLDGKFCYGINATFRIPTGPDAYTSEEYRNLSFGNKELKITPVISIFPGSMEVVSFNISYTFREGRGEGLYDGFRVNPLRGDTYTSIFGLNPWSKGSFLEKGKIENDYASVSASIISLRLSPLIIFGELYYSSSIFRGSDKLQGIMIEGDGVNPMLLSAGIKYIVSGSFYIELSDIVPLIRYDDYIKNTVEISLNIFF